jgi:hypothetical protein
LNLENKVNKYLIVHVGYNHLAVPVKDSGRAGALIAALADAECVESKGYGAELKWVPSGSDLVQVEFVSADRITVGDELATLRAKLAEAEGQAQSYSKYWTAEQATTKRLKEEVASLKGSPVPTSADIDSLI